MANLKSVNIFLDRSEVISDTERLLDHTRGPLSAEAALVAHVCMTRGLTLAPKLSVGHSLAARFFWNTALELRDHVFTRKDSIEKFIVSPLFSSNAGRTTSLSGGYTDGSTGSCSTSMLFDSNYYRVSDYTGTLISLPL